ncbi:hypothetical protein [Rubritalea sp.]|uniref:hypothetical protein n=1 Tax=Rubritalea sp. TaxID=2109375 RepID=UPI003EFAAD1E
MPKLHLRSARSSAQRENATWTHCFGSLAIHDWIDGNNRLVTILLNLRYSSVTVLAPLLRHALID